MCVDMMDVWMDGVRMYAYMMYVRVYGWMDGVCQYACMYSQEPTSVNQPHPHQEFYIYIPS